MKYKTILFDLDGTLTDPQEGICKSINYAVEHFGGQSRPLGQLTKYIGPPLWETFAELLGEENAEAAVVKYRERFSVIGLYENEIYPHVKETLQLLKEKGCVLCTASSKPQVFVQKILEYFDIDKFFTVIGGASLDGKVSEKQDVIDIVLKQAKSEKATTLMVGDTKFDLIGAQRMGLDAIGVTYGFGARDELENHPNIALIDDIRHIVNYL